MQPDVGVPLSFMFSPSLQNGFTQVPTIIVSGPDDHTTVTASPEINTSPTAPTPEHVQTPEPTTSTAAQSSGSVDPSPETAISPFDSTEETTQSATDTTAQPVNPSQTITNQEPSQQPAPQNEPQSPNQSNTSAMNPSIPRRGPHRPRIALSNGRRVPPLPPPPRPESPLIDLDYEEPPAFPGPATVDTAPPTIHNAPPTVDTTPPPTVPRAPIRPAQIPGHTLADRPSISLLDLQDPTTSGSPSQILVSFNILDMCPCNLDGHPCMLPLRCRYHPGVICTKNVRFSSLSFLFSYLHFPSCLLIPTFFFFDYGIV